jgi:3-oxoacyl-[acyl-carrier protein] reductase
MSQKRKAMVTGGSRGIGAAICAELERRGFDVWAPMRAELDLSDQKSIQAFTSSHQPNLDVLINNAGINLIKPLEGLDPTTFAQMEQVNLHAPLALIQWVAPYMRKQKWGRILNISSTFSIVTKEHRAGYSMTKAAINSLTRTACLELGPDNILINALCPGYVDTEMMRSHNSPADIEKICELIALRRMAKPDELAKIAAFLVSEDNNFITGQAIVADGGYTCR